MTLKDEREYKIIEDKLVYKASRILEHYPTTRVLPSLPWKPQRDISVQTQNMPQYIARRLQAWLKVLLPTNWSKRRAKTTRDQCFFISHEVLKPESKTTPCHITFNSSANFWGHALNKNYDKGPDRLNNLFNVLLRFRKEGVAITRDIQKMIHSINIPLLHQMTHCFLWKDLDDQKEPETYVMTAVNMGDHLSGTIAIVSLCKTAEMSSDEFPHSSETILRKSYRDEISESVKTTEEALTLIFEIDKILEHDSFRIKGWAMPGEGREIGQGAQIQNHEDKHLVRGLTGTIDDATELERVLRMGWNSSKERFATMSNWTSLKRSKR